LHFAHISPARRRDDQAKRARGHWPAAAAEASSLAAAGNYSSCHLDASRIATIFLLISAPQAGTARPPSGRWGQSEPEELSRMRDRNRIRLDLPPPPRKFVPINGLCV
jgi:hypothetical protein